MITAELNFLILLHQRSKLEQKTPRAIMVLENTHDSLAKKERKLTQIHDEKVVL